MSTAVMSASPLYEFGDLLYKNNNNNGSGGLQKPAAARWNSVSTTSSSSDSRAVGSPVLGAGLSGLQPLSRRNSNPAGNSGMANSLGIYSSNNINNNANSNSNNNSSRKMDPGVFLGLEAVGTQQLSPHRRLDRSQSEPVERTSNAAVAAAAAAVAAAAAAAAAKSNINTSRYKTELCRPFEESGSCKYGDKCQFAHGAQELRTLVRHPKYKTELCRTYHTIGFCPYGPRCHFIHNAEEARAAAAAALAAQSGGASKSGGGGQQPVTLPLSGPLTPPRQQQHHHHQFYHHTYPKPVPLLGSTGDSPSPPSSLSASPTSLGSFFSEPDLYPGNSFSSPPSSSSSSTSSSANTAFSFGQDFTSLVRLGSLGRMLRKQEPATSPPALAPLAPTGGVLGRRNLSLGDLDGVKETLVLPVAVRDQQSTAHVIESPVGSLEALCLSDASPLQSPSSPGSPKEVGRLPVFNSLSRKIIGADA
ncbi:mRNA decay activator protein ZFP36L2-B [Hetaerina americana]|uniref:mRNA decay activator protein ZFP36L2-B n=1 Tax=Hetaerina americana TaxID=62018 RepID=UPI003A7F1B5B